MKERVLLGKRVKQAMGLSALATASFLGGALVKQGITRQEIKNIKDMDAILDKRVIEIDRKIKETILLIDQAREKAKKEKTELDPKYLEFIKKQMEILEAYRNIKSSIEKSKIPPASRRFMNSQQ